MNKPVRPRGQATKGDTNCFSCQWRERSQWGVLDEEDLRELNDRKTCRIYEPGQVIFAQGDPCRGVFCAESGTVAIRKTDEHGNSVLVSLRHAGESAGYRDFFAGDGHSTSAEAVARSNICFISNDAVNALLKRSPSLGLDFLKRIAGDLRDAEENILQASSLTVRARLAHLLLTLKDRYSATDGDGALTIDLPLARQDIAAVLGARPETIARAIHALETDKVASFSGRAVVVNDLDRLLEEIEPRDEF